MTGTARHPDSRPFFGADDPFMLVDVERIGFPPQDPGDKPILGLVLYFQKPFQSDPVTFSMVFLMDPDGAVENFLSSEETVDELFERFSPETPAEQQEEPTNG